MSEKSAEGSSRGPWGTGGWTFLLDQWEAMERFYSAESGDQVGIGETLLCQVGLEGPDWQVL